MTDIAPSAMAATANARVRVMVLQTPNTVLAIPRMFLTNKITKPSRSRHSACGAC